MILLLIPAMLLLLLLSLKSGMLRILRTSSLLAWLGVFTKFWLRFWLTD